MISRSHTIEVWGDLACFTRPEMKVERYSYPIITPSAARGIFDAIYWDGRREEKKGRRGQFIIRPYFYWQITRIEVLAFPRYIALRRNEVKDKAPTESRIKEWMNGSPVTPIWADATGKANGRTQRQTMALKNVRYRLTAEVVTKSNNDFCKLNESFSRRAKAGQCFQQPYLGCREFPAYFEYVDNSGNTASKSPVVLNPVPLNLNVGWMLYDVFDLRAKEAPTNPKPFISLFNAHIQNGVLEVPRFEDDLVRKPEKR